MKKPLQIAAGLVLLTLMALGGCASAPNKVVGTSDYVVKSVEFRGVSRFSDAEIIDYLYAGETTWIPMTPDYPFDAALVVSDGRRIEELYRSFGYYDAHVVDYKVTPDHEEREAHLKFTVSEGKPTLVDSVKITWTAEPADISFKADVEKKSELVVGEAFEAARYNGTLGALRQALLNAGYPLAAVTGQAQIDPYKRFAKAEFTVEPGARATIGKVTFEGLHEVPEYLVQREIEFAQGEQYSPQRVFQMEQAVKAMRVFRWVSTRPAESVQDGKVDLVMRVSEADPQTIRLGLALAVDTVRWQQQGRLEYNHTNLFGHLTRLDLIAIAGWAELPNPLQNDLNGPAAVIRPKFTKKGILEKHLLWSFTPKAKIDLEEGYQYYQLSERFGVSRWFDGYIRLAAAHSIRYVNFFNISPELDANTSILGRDFRDPYVLSDVTLRGQVFLADSITSPKDGAIFETAYTIASDAIGSDFNFHRLAFHIRGYLQAADWLQFASRIRTGVIVPFGSKGGAPFDRRFYLGGSNSVRGWGSRRLSPRVEDCNDQNECESIPVGGYSMVQGNVEARIHIVGPLSIVGFFDMGDVQRDEWTYKLDEWNYSAGPGLRVKTPMGMLRIDAGFRLNDPGVYDEKLWAIYLGFGETL